MQHIIIWTHSAKSHTVVLGFGTEKQCLAYMKELVATQGWVWQDDEQQWRIAQYKSGYMTMKRQVLLTPPTNPTIGALEQMA